MKKYIVVASILISGLFIISSYQTQESTAKHDYQIHQGEDAPKKKFRPVQKKHNHRHIASVSNHSAPTTKGSNDIAKVVAIQLTKEDIKVIDKVKSAVPTLAQSDFKILKRLKITEKSIYAVNYNKEGFRRSFKILVDNKSGRIEKSWGKTHYESPLTTRFYPVESN